MKSLYVLLISTLIIASCAGESDKLGQILPKEVKYELSGGAGHYNYAPSVIQDEYGIRYAYMCQNRNPFEIVDYIYLYKGIPTKDGYVWQPGTEVVPPSADGWDDCHICDPDVREFTTKWKGRTYTWIMTYLGVDQWDCNHNQIGLAVAENIEGPWTKVDFPIVPYEGRDKWGVGMSTTIVKNDSTILLFYSSSGENGPWAMREVILNDVDNIRLGEEKNVPFMKRGINYPAISKAKDRLYRVSEIRTEGYDWSLIPSWVGDVCQVAYMPLLKEDPFNVDQWVNPAEDPWIEIHTITPEVSGFPRNHNPGFLTDTKGFLVDDNELVVYFTPAVTGSDWLWSYDLWSATYDISSLNR